MARAHAPGCRTRRLAGVLVASALCAPAAALVVAPAAPASATGRPPVTRLAGADRYGTAAAISQATFAPGVATAYVATGENFPDALSAAAAAAGHAPVLLVTASSVPPATAGELQRLAPHRVVVVGGTTAVSDATAAAAGALAGNVTVARLAGADRYGTAAAVSAATFAPGSPDAFVASGAGWVDALAGAAAAGGRGPVLLTSPTGLPPAAAAELGRLKPHQVVALGGSSALPDAVVASAASSAGNVPSSRWAGLDPYGDAAAISAASFSPGLSSVFLATSNDFADALAGAAVASGRGPVLIVDPGTLPDVEAAELRRLHASSTTVFGGVAAVSDAVAALSDRITAQGIPPARTSAGVAVATAQAQLGKPYVWGGAGPNSFDCSGLTMFSWAAASVSLPHNAAMQDDLVADIPVSAAQPGDLLFYGSPVYHVAMYVGNGQMIEAANSSVPVRQVPVRTQDLANAGRP